MAKKKNKQNQQILSPEKYVRTKARNLPIEECLINDDWKNAGECNIIIARRHASGNYTLGIFLVDLYCVGVKDCFYRYNIPEYEYDKLKSGSFLTPISYNEAHNLIYGSVAYAEDLGIQSYKDFEIVQYILEPDTDDIPLIEYDFGYEGQPFLIAKSKLEAEQYLPALKKSVGDAFRLSIGGRDEEFGEDDDSSFDYLDLPETTYSYSYPEYPKELILTHKEELKDFFSPEYTNSLEREIIDKILSLPRESLIKDLKNIILYEIGRTYEAITNDTIEEPYIAPIFHAILFLGELKAEDSLEVVLEVMRQNDPFREYHFGDAMTEIIPLTLYYTGKNQLSKWMEYAKEPGLDPYMKLNIFSAASIIAMYEPERRKEIIDWFRDILNFYTENVDDSDYFDASLTGMMTSDLIDIKAIELLPEIERLYATGCVDEMCCGNYQTIENKIKSDKKPLTEFTLMNIYERYAQFEKKWGK